MELTFFRKSIFNEASNGRHMAQSGKKLHNSRNDLRSGTLGGRPGPSKVGNRSYQNFEVAITNDMTWAFKAITKNLHFQIQGYESVFYSCHELWNMINMVAWHSRKDEDISFREEGRLALVFSVGNSLLVEKVPSTLPNPKGIQLREKWPSPAIKAILPWSYPAVSTCQ